MQPKFLKCSKKTLLTKVFFSLLFILLFSGRVQAIEPVNYKVSHYNDTRKIYLDTMDLIDRGELAKVPENIKKLKKYPLVGYIYYRLFIMNLNKKTPKQVILFQERFQSYPFSAGLANRYLRSLVKVNNYNYFLEFQKNVPLNTELACFYYRSKLYKGESPSTVWQDAKNLWLNGKSLPKSCDPLIAYYRKSGKLDDVLNLSRIQLAFAENQLSIMTLLTKQIKNTQLKKVANDIIALYKDPSQLSSFSKKYATQKGMPELIIESYKRLARKNKTQAIALYNPIFRDSNRFSELQKQKAAEAVINYLIVHDLPSSQQKWRDEQLSKTKDPSLIYRRFRLAIRDVNWDDMSYWLQALPEVEKTKLFYSYWQARVLLHKKHKTEALAIFKQMLGVQDIYSVMAAVHLGVPITYPESGTKYQPEQLNLIADSIIRVHELITTDHQLEAQQEWQYLLKNNDSKPLQLALANYAKLAGKIDDDFYNLAIATTIKGKLWDQRDLRFPLAYYPLYQKYEKEYKIPITTMMALSRQESVFNPNVKSRAGAIGLMQLMPATAKAMAKKLDIEMNNVELLKDPELNIQLGGKYLRELLDKFDNNRIYTFASYNAGPNRVAQWKAKTGQKLDAFAFIESIPFSETRGYVQNLLMFETYYQRLLKKPIYLFTQKELKTKY